MLKISLVMPCYNEQEVIAHTIDTLLAKMKEYNFDDYEIVIVDDGSIDNSLNILKIYASQYSHVKVVSFAANRGQQAALFAGLCYSSGQAVIFMDADLQDPPECIPQMIQLWEQGYQVVYGKRNQRQGESFFKKVTAYLFYRLLTKLSYTDFPVDVGDFRLMDRVVVDTIINMEERTRFNRALVSWLGFKQIELPFDRPERFAGETKFSTKHMINLAKDALFSFSYAPIYFIQFLGISSIIVSMGLFIYVLVSKYIWQQVSSGWSSLMIIIAFFSGAILFALGIIGEYIIRIHIEVMKRPIFVSSKTFNLENKTLPSHVAQFISVNNPSLK